MSNPPPPSLPQPQKPNVVVLSAASWSLNAIHRISTPPDDARFVVRVGVTAWVDIVSYAAYLATIAPLDARGTVTPRAGMRDPRPITEREQS